MAAYGIQTTVRGSLDQVRAKVAEALKQQDFGILTETNVQKTLKEKTRADFNPYLILGACDPQLAHRALSVNRALGLPGLLPMLLATGADVVWGKIAVVVKERYIYRRTKIEAFADVLGLRH
jgi:uncharacterized protein (DUF302 family)